MTPVTNENYYSPELSREYLGASQFKSFLRCEAQTIHGLDHPTEPTKPMLIGSYLDSMVEGTQSEFETRYADVIFKKRGSGLYAEFERVQELYKRMYQDEFFSDFLRGDKQAIFTGKIKNIPVKAKTDIYLADERIVDLKTTQNFQRRFSTELNSYVSFAQFWRYDIQGAIYQELVYQQTGKKLPFYLAAITTEAIPDLAILEIPQQSLDLALSEVELDIERFQAIKLGIFEPDRCERCDYCKSTKKLYQVQDYREIGI